MFPKSGTYQGEQGGFYPGGSNVRPAAHDADLMGVGAPGPLDAAGASDPASGKIGFISCGMSNATQEFSVFKTLADSYPDKNPQVVIVDCAFPGETASVIQNPADPCWASRRPRMSKRRPLSLNFPIRTPPMAALIVSPMAVMLTPRSAALFRSGMTRTSGQDHEVLHPLEFLARAWKQHPGPLRTTNFLFRPVFLQVTRP